MESKWRDNNPEKKLVPLSCCRESAVNTTTCNEKDSLDIHTKVKFVSSSNILNIAEPIIAIIN